MNISRRQNWFDDSYSEWEDQYADQGLRGRQVRKRMELAYEYLCEERLPPGARILDLGCGPGIIAEKISSGNYQVSCVDFSPEMLLRARERLKGSGCKPAAYIQADAQSLPFKTGTFDAVLCIGVVSWVEDPDMLLNETARVLRPGGILIITAINMLSIENLFDPLFWWRSLLPSNLRAKMRDIVGTAVVNKGKDGYLNKYQFRLRYFDRMLESAGFKKTRWRTIKYGHFRLFKRRLFPVFAEVAIDRAFECLWWVPVIRSLGWLYCVKAMRKENGIIVQNH